MLRLIMFLAVLFSVTVNASQNSFIALSYHDVFYEDENKNRDTVSPNDASISVDMLIAHFNWMRDNNYNPVSLDQIQKAQQGLQALPENAVLLTFDDGYKSFYTTVYPLLKAFDYPAVFAVVGSWLEVEQGEMVNYGKKKRSRSDFVSWEQLKIMADSGLVEIASHTYDLHKGIIGNPQGNEQPAAITLRYDEKTKQYESLAERTERIKADLKKNNTIIYEKTGYKPRSIVWPYGEFSPDLERIARKLGLEYSINLIQKINTVEESAKIGRVLVTYGSELDKLVYRLKNMDVHPPVRAAHVDLDYVYDANPEQQHRNLSALLDRIKHMGINTVYLQAFADSDGDGNADALYFPNRHLPVKADLFNRVAWQLRTRSNVKVYAWLPVLSFLIPDTESLRVREKTNGEVSVINEEYIRLSPFSDKAIKLVEEIYEDLTLHAHFDGLLFHDDAYLSDNEDFHPDAMAHLQKVLEKEISGAEVQNDYAKTWQQLKIMTLNNVTEKLAYIVRQHKSYFKSARNVYANILMMPQSSSWFAQNYITALRSYDYVVVMAMPYMEQVKEHEKWYVRLITRAKQFDPSLNKTVFELQTLDWNTKTSISNEILYKTFRLLLINGVKNIAWYPDDFIAGHPDAELVRSTISIIDKPFFKERRYD